MKQLIEKTKPETTQSQPTAVINQVIKKVLFTRTELTIYPDGKTYQNSKTWFQKGQEVVQPKKKVKITSEYKKSKEVKEI